MSQTDPANDDELLKYFWPHPYPKSHPPTQVTFNNGLPESDRDRIHMWSSVSWHVFKTAVEAEVTRKQLELLERLENPQLTLHAGKRGRYKPVQAIPTSRIEAERRALGGVA